MSCLLLLVMALSLTSHTRFDAGCGVLVHRAGRSHGVQLLDQQTILLLGSAHVTRCQGRFKVLNLGLDHALTCTVLNPSFGILPNSFFGG